jgi:hypothetical protein
MTFEQQNGNVNFDAGLIKETAQHQMAVADNVQQNSSTDIGGARVLGNVETPAPVVKTNIHKIGFGFMVTLNMGFPLIEGLKELRNVQIGSNSEPFNFYNPFMRGNPERGIGEGLLRKTMSGIARQANSILGSNVVFLGTDADAEKAIADMSRNLLIALEKRFPVSQSTYILEVPVEIDGVENTRPIYFGELFGVKSLNSVDTDEETGVTTHYVTLNIIVNAGALYDAEQPHAFVRKARSFVENTIKARQLGNVTHNVAVSIDSESLVFERMRDMLHLLVAEDKFYVVSRASVLRGEQPLFAAADVDNVFGYGSDMLLLSPYDTDDAAGDAVADGE